MPTDVKIQLTISGVSAKDYYRVILEDESLIKRFHADVNNDPNATVSTWEDDHRTVAFHMTLNVPGMIKKMIGTDHIRIQEVTKITWKGPSCFELSTEPCLDFPGANKFTTSGTTVVSDTPAGCQIDCTLRCTAALPWPMQGSVEAVMANEGKQTVTKYLEYTKQACEEDKNNRAAAPAATATAAARSQPPPLEKASAAAGAGAATDTMDEEEWHDFEDEGDMDGPGAVPPSTAPPGPRLPLRVCLLPPRRLHLTRPLRTGCCWAWRPPLRVPRCTSGSSSAARLLLERFLTQSAWHGDFHWEGPHQRLGSVYHVLYMRGRSTPEGAQYSGFTSGGHAKGGKGWPPTSVPSGTG